ncbi:hypothetical protein BX661DRAFT_183426 [Kickxella alabastrina]|uniref:uncharacterized protein n=1 Tax=Kickxella alabastrina TaxID=61397 RepID=UPI002220C4B6|nr:uncharacterized protein BX661DRAFT_183426 [Kickxella alabastrina]KAI7826761.1 hypothetical protein BX661DRAFT_183426 [Kickxella alabastrina]
MPLYTAPPTCVAVSSLCSFLCLCMAALVGTSSVAFRMRLSGSTMRSRCTVCRNSENRSSDDRRADTSRSSSSSSATDGSRVLSRRISSSKCVCE